ncbi:MAG: DUF790 family protein [Candidatus Njordarchaeia archaeon]
MISLSALPLRYSRDRVYPIFLDVEDKNVVSAVIDYAESLVGKNVSDSQFKMDLEAIVKDFKKARALYYVLKFFYSLEKPGLDEILGAEAGKNFKMDDWGFKKDFYMWVNQRYRFVKPEKREEILREYAEEKGIPKEAVEKIIENELPQNQVFKRKVNKPPQVDKVIGLYNFLLIEKLLSISERVIFEAYEYMGRIVKEVLMRIKYYEIVADIYKMEKGIKIDITGPHQIFKQPAVSEYGKQIAATISPILTITNKWSLWMKIILRKKPKKCQIYGYKENSPKLTAYWEIKKNERPRNIHDSTIEEKIYNTLKTIFKDRGIQIEREQDILITPKTGKIMIPDFTITKENKKIYMEVVGYWRKEYVEKKIEKLKELQGNKNLIIVVDKKLEKHFKQINIPQIPYYRDEIPIGKIYKQILCVTP